MKVQILGLRGGAGLSRVTLHARAQDKEEYTTQQVQHNARAAGWWSKAVPYTQQEQYTAAVVRIFETGVFLYRVLSQAEPTERAGEKVEQQQRKRGRKTESRRNLTTRDSTTEVQGPAQLHGSSHLAGKRHVDCSCLAVLHPVAPWGHYHLQGLPR